jgi:multicomponent Na+:H+ antiporter subunit G
MTVTEVIGAVLMSAGTVLSVLAAWGILNFPSPISRLHAATKPASLGLALLALGAGVAAGSWGLIGVAGLITVFLFVTTPISGHLLGRAAYLAGQAGHLVHNDLIRVHPEPLQAGEPVEGGFSITRWAALIAVWMLLWRDVSVGTLIGGIVVATVVETVRRGFGRDTNLQVWGLVVFLARYHGMVLSSNLRVAWEVITPSNEQIREAIVAVPLKTTSIPAALLVANAVSYTPGSLTLELTDHPRVLYVHVLHFTTIEDVQRQVARLERLVSRALPERNTA